MVGSRACRAKCSVVARVVGAADAPAAAQREVALTRRLAAWLLGTPVRASLGCNARVAVRASG